MNLRQKRKRQMRSPFDKVKVDLRPHDLKVGNLITNDGSVTPAFTINENSLRVADEVLEPLG